MSACNLEIEGHADDCNICFKIFIVRPDCDRNDRRSHCSSKTES